MDLNLLRFYGFREGSKKVSFCCWLFICLLRNWIFMTFIPHTYTSFPQKNVFSRYQSISPRLGELHWRDSWRNTIRRLIENFKRIDFLANLKWKKKTERLHCRNDGLGSSWRSQVAFVVHYGSLLFFPSLSCKSSWVTRQGRLPLWGTGMGNNRNLRNFLTY